MEWQDRCLQEHELLVRTLFALEYLRHSPYSACKAGKGLGSREAEGGCKVETGKDVVADGAASSEECEVIVADIVDGVVVDSGVGAYVSPLRFCRCGNGFLHRTCQRLWRLCRF